MNSSPKTSFPWRPDNSFQLLIDGEQFYPAILKTISQAKSHILIEMYLVESGNNANAFIDLLIHQAQQGILVKLLFDSFGSNKFTVTDRDRLRNAPIELVFYNPVRLTRFKRSLHRTHRKIIVVDGVTAFTGGAGITDSFTGSHAWREAMVKVTGSEAADWQTLFINNFQQLADTQQIPTPLIEVPINTNTNTNTNKEAQARVVYSNGGTKIELKRSLISHIRRGKKTVWLATAYFIPSRKIRRALRLAAKSGLDVRLLLPGEVTDHPAIIYASRRYYARLLRHGVRIYEYQGRFMHAKVALIDEWVSIGSSNMDRWNWLWNLEANQEIIDNKLAAEVKKMLLDDFDHSKEITFSEWSLRSRLQRFQEWLWGKVDLWLSQWKK